MPRGASDRTTSDEMPNKAAIPPSPFAFLVVSQFEFQQWVEGGHSLKPPE
jgi:hypothetical protein